MKIYQLNYPGSRLNYADDKTNMNVYCLLILIEMELSQAVMSLHFYILDNRRWNEEIQRDSKLDADAMRAKWLKEAAKRQEMEDKYKLELSNGDPNYQPSWSQMLDISSRIEAELEQKNKELDPIPKEYKNALALLYSKSFITSLDTIGRLIDSLCEVVSVFQPQKQSFNVKQQFKDFFANLRDVRNSVQHSEQRILGLTHKTPINLQPINGPGIYAPNGAIALNGLGSETYGTIVADGHYAIVELNSKSLEKVQDCIQKVVNTLIWEGHSRQYPN